MREDMVYLDPDGGKFSDRQMARKIVPAFLSNKAKVLYVDRGGEDARTKEDVLKIVLQVQKSVKVRHSVWDERDRGNNDRDRGDRNRDRGHREHNNRNNRDKRGDDNRSGGTPSDSGGGKTTSQPCRKHDGAHLWKDCLDNKYSNNYKGDGSTKDNGGRRSNKNGKLKSTENTGDLESKTTPAVAFNLTYESDDELAQSSIKWCDSGNGDMLAITVHGIKTKEDALHPVTAVVLVGPNRQV